MGKTKVDLTGQRRGKLLVLSENFDKKRRHWNCICDCGATRVVRQDALKPGGTESCGECIYDSQVSYSPEYFAWQAAKQRCFNPKTSNYSDYGGRGITMCPEWVDNFDAFYEHIGPRPKDRPYLDRIDFNGHYEPGNVAWVTAKQSSINTRVNKNNSSGTTGVHYNAKSRGKLWSAEIIRDGKKYYLGRFETKEEAVAARKAKEQELDN